MHLSHERFLREARAVATLNHPNICAIHDVGEQDGQPYLVMELLRGETLKLYLSRHSLSAAEVLTLGQQAASALAAAHARGSWTAISSRVIPLARICAGGGQR